MLLDIAFITGAYLIGSISTAIIVARAMGLTDPRNVGSKNPGATNVLRYGGKKAAALTLLGDSVKGVIPVLLAKPFIVSDASMALVGVAAFLGHLYPIFFGFKGGKGVATALGVLLALSWPVGVAALVTWVVMAVVFRISSLSALVASALTPVYMWYFVDVPEYLWMNIFITILLIWRHRSNIQNLVSGKEGRIAGNKES
ncbi:MAG: glycerol-3-phosphate 1-O-acyltransferase PlsY [Gammaproteobacteria bacterium]|nr:glycerol-3-phosphate 1-O-acyltransferase PlsY [Gammaproteobacteria bacterium]